MLFLLVLVVSQWCMLSAMDQQLKIDVFSILPQKWQLRVNAVAENLPRDIGGSDQEILAACVQARKNVWAEKVAAVLANNNKSDRKALKNEMDIAATVQHGNGRRKA